MIEKKKRVIAAGHICLDITPIFPDRRVDQIGQILQPGKLINMEHADVHTGGSVANTGLALKYFGAEVSLMGKIGKDAFGDLLLELLNKEQAGQGMIRDDNVTTSYSVVLAIPGIDRIFLHHPGANDRFLAEDISEEELKHTDLFHFGYPPIMASMYENEGAELVKVMRRAKIAGAATSLDLAAVDPNAPAGKVNWKKILEKVLPFVDFFVPSIEELCYMLDKKRLQEWQTRAKGGDITQILELKEDIRPLADQCMELGCKVLLLKCGAPGLYFQTAKQETLMGISLKSGVNPALWAEQAFFEKSYQPSRVLSGTGAGDTCIAAFLTSALNGYDPKRCVRLAAAAGASCVESYDALSGLKPLSELEKRIADGWEKVSKIDLYGNEDEIC